MNPSTLLPLSFQIFSLTFLLSACSEPTKTSHQPQPPILRIILADSCGLSGSQGVNMVTDVDSSGKHPIQGLDAFLETHQGFGSPSIVGVQLQRAGKDPILIGRTTAMKQHRDIPNDSFITEVSVEVNQGRPGDLSAVKLFWQARSNGGSGFVILGTPLLTDNYLYHYRRFQGDNFQSYYEINGLQGYTAKDDTLRSLGTFRSIRTGVTNLYASGQSDGPAGLATGTSGGTDATSSRKLLKLHLWSDNDGLYGIQLVHCAPNGTDLRVGPPFGFERGTSNEFTIYDTEYIASMAGKIDSTGVRHLTLEVFDYKTHTSRAISTAGDPHIWRNANDLVFRLPRTWSTNGLTPSARIYGFLGWTANSRITSIGPYYATAPK